MRFCATIAQARLLDDGVDGAGQIAAGRVGLDDREGALEGHGTSWLRLRKVARLIATRPRPIKANPDFSFDEPALVGRSDQSSDRILALNRKPAIAAPMTGAMM